jgi:hypothetical protein
MAGLTRCRIAWREPINRAESLPRPRSYYAAQGNATRSFFRGGSKSQPHSWTQLHLEAFSCSYYLLSGGFSKPALYPERWLPTLENLDRKLSRWPRLFAARCLICLSPCQA